ncbi:hypothetical protein M409DRAFT_70031 [Zasmidium cellare ATCC 36951]|uniref:Osmotin, thaumatin-like protein n=1 Tax=Zasmidium cellare ATCC 36951 TaxID=1080233 RepID=A0A6A6C1L3_ZASCE|nr:uncharacterized protein M409DRAFT_70031 [Zasmidium cellare ATCC 36951]KAF2160944.1 hypothetical protein M409DRAFT_70031 [Zasmidium cellare ATCC 36951]
MGFGPLSWANTLLSTTCFAAFALSEHHIERVIAPRQGTSGGTLDLYIINECQDTIWPGLVTQGGSTGPNATGFKLDPGNNKTVHVGADWQGRIWGRTNCTFPNGPGSNGACKTGECGALDCRQAGNPPATLAEFTMDGGQDQSFYDISLVDGYNLPLAIVLLPNGVQALQKLDPSGTNPSCVGSIGDFAGSDFNPYTNNQQFLGTNSSSPIDFDNKVTADTVSKWCPWDCQVDTPTSQGDGVYPYPDGNVARPAFNPCNSACQRYHSDQYCCTGANEARGSCQPNYYSKAAKSICPDAYSFPQDDQSSTFIVPKGAEYQVIFCPGGRSTNIIASNKK